MRKTQQYDTYKKLRKEWNINPKTKIKPNDKSYNRKKEKQRFLKEQNVQNDSE